MSHRLPPPDDPRPAPVRSGSPAAPDVSSGAHDDSSPAVAPRTSATRMLVLVAAGQFLGMTLWFSATAAAPAIASELGLTSAGTAWLTMAVQAGFVAGTLV